MTALLDRAGARAELVPSEADAAADLLRTAAATNADLAVSPRAAARRCVASPSA